MTLADFNITNRGTGVLPNAKWNSTDHTNSLIPLFAAGAKASLFSNSYNGIDPVWGNYIDNILIGTNLIILAGN